MKASGRCCWYVIYICNRRMLVFMAVVQNLSIWQVLTLLLLLLIIFRDMLLIIALFFFLYCFVLVYCSSLSPMLVRSSHLWPHFFNLFFSYVPTLTYWTNGFHLTIVSLLVIKMQAHFLIIPLLFQCSCFLCYMCILLFYLTI